MSDKLLFRSSRKYSIDWRRWVRIGKVCDVVLIFLVEVNSALNKRITFQSGNRLRKIEMNNEWQSMLMILAKREFVFEKNFAVVDIVSTDIVLIRELRRIELVERIEIFSESQLTKKNRKHRTWLFREARALIVVSRESCARRTPLSYSIRRRKYDEATKSNWETLSTLFRTVHRSGRSHRK